MPNKFALFDFSQKVNYKNEILAGLTVAMTMIPESLSFAIFAGLSPLTGLYGAFMMGLVTAVIGGRPGMVSGAAGATVIVLIALIQNHGTEYLFATVALAGVIQILVGVFKLGKFVRLIPEPVMYGFLNGLAVIIFMSQLDQFKLETTNGLQWLSGTAFWMMLFLVLLTITIINILPRLTKAIPASLLAIITIFILVSVAGIDTKTVKDIAGIKGTFPPFHIPLVPVTWETFTIIAPYALVMASVGLLESLLTLTIVDEVTDTRGNSNRECLAQGTANVVNGFFSGMGGCAMIAQTFVNLNAGARARLSGIVGAFTILFIILFGSSLIEKIPMAALTGVMMMVAISTFKWGTFNILNKMPKSDVFICMTVALITILLHNLALAVLAGVIIAALVFAWDNAKMIRARKHIDESGVKHYQIYGPLFFGSATTFMEKFDIQEDPQEVIIDFAESRIVDMSALEALNKITDRYTKAGKHLALKNINDDGRRLIENAKTLIQVNVIG